MGPINWKKIEQGSVEAFSEMYHFYYKKLYNYGRKFTDDAPLIEDAVGDALAYFWINKHKIKKIENLQSYLFLSFRNNLLATIKKTERVRSFNDGEIEILFQPDTIVIAGETDHNLYDELKLALSTLTSRQREAIFLRFYESLSYEEIAEVLGISVKATYKLVARALFQLKRYISVSIASFIFLLKTIQPARIVFPGDN